MEKINETYKVAVVATMSSGKSTFINSLLGEEILTARNTACTGNIVEILNNNTKKKFEATITDLGNKVSVNKIADNNYVSEFNENKIKNLSLEGQFFKIKNNDKKLMIVDTPGVNNSQDGSHMQKTYDFLNDFKEGMIIYVINATQFGVDDDYNFLTYISSVLRSSPELEFIVLVNKIDEIDFELENVEMFLDKVDSYIKNIGIKNYKVIPISALSALLFRKALSGQGDSFSRRQRKVFYDSLEFWSSNQLIKREFSTFISQECESQKVFFEGEYLDSMDLERAIYNTGITTVEDLIATHLGKKGNIQNLTNEEQDRGEEFYINVISAKNAGKSTLINSMLGVNILPSSNKECKTTITRIKNIDSDKVYVECRDVNKNIIQERRVINKEDLDEFNQDEKIKYMDIECKISDVSVKNKKIIFADTRCLNKQNESYKEIIDKIINDRSINLYVLDGNQIGTSDEWYLLNDITDAIKRKGNQLSDRFIFVVNKCDEFDTEKGDELEKILGNVRKYLKGFGIENPNIFPITAKLAKVIRMSQKGEMLSRSEKKELNQYDDFIDYEDLHFEKFASLTPTVRKKINEKIELAKRNNKDYELALIHSGVPCLEGFIEEYISKLDT